MLKRFSYSIFLCLIATIPFVAKAQNWSYIYIQGDKQIPFYVKLEGAMMPRYSKNYCIIPQLEAGRVHVTILFQQNQYQQQEFTILVPDNSYRGFLLTRKDNGFALYDVQQHFYLLPGPAGDDRLPEEVTTAPPLEVVEGLETGSTEPPFLPDIEFQNNHPAPIVEKPIQKPQPRVIEKPVRQPVYQEPLREAPQPKTVNIADEPALDEPAYPRSQKQVSGSNAVPATKKEEAYNMPPEPVRREVPQPVARNEGNEQMQDPGFEFGTPTAAIINSDCPNPLSDKAFDEIYQTTIGKEEDDKRILYLMKEVPDNCFTSRQAAVLATRLKGESMKYSLLKKMYPRIVDQQNFPQLENLFKTMEWKAYFRLIQ